jgi:hypothetical protein
MGETQFHVAGIDNGFGTIKNDIFAGDDTMQFLMQSTVGIGGPRRMAKQTGSDIDPNLDTLTNQLNVMDVEITNISAGEPPKHYFFGRLAVYEAAKSHYCWDDDKASDEEAMALLVTQLAVAQAMNNYGIDSSKGMYYVGTGLPIRHYFDLKETYEQKIKGKYEVVFKSGPLENTKCSIHIIKCRVYPQGWGIYNDQVYNNRGDIVNQSLKKGHVLVLDPGFRTTEIALFLNGKLVDSFSDSLDYGVAGALKQVSDDVEKNLHIILSEKELDNLFMSSKNIYEDGDTVVDLTSYRDKWMKTLARQLNEELKAKLQDVWPKITRILLGGGGGAGLQDYLKWDGKDVILAENPQFGNASGFKKAIQSLIVETAKITSKENA